jgi:hypothetical protein
MNQNVEFNRIFDLIKNQLEPGVTYHSYFIRSAEGKSMSGKSFFKLTDGKPDFQIPECLGRSRLSRLEPDNKQVIAAMDELVYASDPGTLTYFTISEDAGFKAEIANADILINLMKYEMATNVDSGTRKEILVKVFPIAGTPQPELESWQKIYYPDSEPKEYTGAPINSFIIPLYFALDKKLQAVYIEASETAFEIMTSPEIPGLTKPYEFVEDLTLDASNIQNIYTFMESWSEAKIAKAVEALETNPDFKAKAEKRYLQFIRARTGKNSGLESFANATLSRKETDLFGDEHFAENVISLSYLNQKECQAMVDFIGSLVINHLDINLFKDQMEAAENMDYLYTIYFAAAEKVKNGMIAEAQQYLGGWFGKISMLLANHKVEKVLFEKTHFIVEKNDLLKAFVFYLDINNGDELYLDIFQSYLPELTEFFWFLPNLPKTSWGDTEVALPEYTLKFRRKSYYRLGDDQEWLRKSPSPRIN